MFVHCEQIGTPGGTRCVQYMQLRSGKMVSPRPNEETSLGGDAFVSQATDVGSDTIYAVSTAYSGPILTPRQPETPRPSTIRTSRQYMPSLTMPMYRTLGMPTDFMAGMHNSSSTFGETPSSPFPRYQGLGPLANQFGRPPKFRIFVSVNPNFHIKSCRSHETTDG